MVDAQIMNRHIRPYIAPQRNIQGFPQQHSVNLLAVPPQYVNNTPFIPNAVVPPYSAIKHPPDNSLPQTILKTSETIQNIAPHSAHFSVPHLSRQSPNPC